MTSLWQNFRKHEAYLISRMIQQQITVYHDEIQKTIRLCPVAEGSEAVLESYGLFLYTCSKAGPFDTT